MKFKNFLSRVDQTSWRWTDSFKDSLLNIRSSSVFRSAGDLILEQEHSEKRFQDQMRDLIEKRKKLNQLRAFDFRLRRRVEQHKSEVTTSEIQNSKLENLTAARITCQEKLDESETLRNKSKTRKARATKNYKIISKLLKDAEQEFDTINKWLDDHGVKFIIIQDSSNKNADPEGEASTRMFLELCKILPDNPEDIFCIEFRYIKTGEKKFRVRKILPSFSKAEQLINQVNDTQDFLDFYQKCKKYWIQNHSNVTPTVMDISEKETSSPPVNHSVSLFDSPSSISFSELPQTDPDRGIQGVV